MVSAAGHNQAKIIQSIQDYFVTSRGGGTDG